MPGKTQRKYTNENVQITKEYNKYIKELAILFPKNYTKSDVLNLFKIYYPFEWNKLIERQKYYTEKDNFLKKVGKKKRYYAKSPQNFFFDLTKLKHLLSDKERSLHNSIIIKEDYQSKKEYFINKRNKKIEIFSKKIEDAKTNAQQVSPPYIETLINEYHKGKLNTEQKLIILYELTKFDTEKVTTFFRKINDAEQNNMLRTFAFYHLQKYGHYVTLRGNMKGKQKLYHLETADLSAKNPQFLYELLEKHPNITCQNYDYFISHSSKDREWVLQTIRQLNEKGKYCYCDWALDDTYLKRELADNFTKEVLKRRMDQSNALILLKSNNSLNSDWVKMELDYFSQLDKDIFLMEAPGAQLKKYDHNKKENL